MFLKYKMLPLAAIMLTGSVNADAVVIKNPGFESGLTYWTIIDDARASIISNSGTQSLQLMGSPARVHQWVDVEKNTDYILTGYVNGSGKFGVNNGYDVVKKVVFDVSKWKKAVVTFNSKSRSRIQVYTKFNDEFQHGYFDDIQIVRADAVPTDPTEPTDPTPVPEQCGVTKLEVIEASDDGSYNNNYSPEKAIDGFLTNSSRWSSKGDGKWIQFDLGGETTIDSIKTAWLSADKRTAYFDIETSLDGENWVPVVTDAESQGDDSLNKDDLGDVYARFIRIVGYGNSSSEDSEWNSLLDVEVYGCGEFKESPIETPTEPTEPTEPPASCPITRLSASASDNGTSSGNYEPSLAVDGSLKEASRWSSKGDGKWLQLDLGGETTVDSIQTAWYSADKRTAYFDIAASLDGVNWDSILTGAESQGDEDLSANDLGDVYARFIRVIGQGNSSSEDYEWNSLLEAQLYGCGELVDSPIEVPTDPTDPTEPTDPTDPGESIPDLVIPENITNGSIFDLEGSDPRINDSTLVFLALEEQVTTPNGNGWRHEYKIKESKRIAMTDTYEEFQATIKVDLSTGGKTIVAQHHAGDTGTIMKLYVSDTDESGFYDSKAANGIFDVYVRILNKSGKEEKKALGTIKTGDSFTFHVLNDYGVVKVSAFGKDLETEVEDDSESYFKFGNYLQSQYPEGNDNCGEHGDSSSFKKCFEKIGITTSKITMTDVTYVRKTK
ncbi:discoidin domain-containing protein [Pseudoalteromonas carrageenovora]|uniref:discoidin domain-containing protein n=1 Tax=Pseudoalteromonas carrageenovora TaxID=227 RepID=UPI0021194F7C|nr:discoidin domain-containing protein [Pseudoalteromonas carrageenovora]MCQ8889812.1 discoidin domain-containing protein [Pseudoalteromonas carrageenovora]